MNLPLSGRTLLYESPINPAHYDDAYQVIRAAAARGDNVGIDEYPTYEYFRRELLDCATASASLSSIRGDNGARSMIGLSAVVPCRYGRSSNPNVGKIVTAVSSSDPGIHQEAANNADSLLYRDLVAIGTSLACSGTRYGACVADVFVPCLRRLESHRAEGFAITACMPNAGKLTGQTAGNTDNYILYKELDSTRTATVSCTLWCFSYL